MRAIPVHTAIRLVTAIFFALGLALAAVGLRAAGNETAIVLRIIVVGSLDDARRIVAELQRGESFVSLAHRESLDATSKAGGLIGRVEIATLRPELRRAIEGVKPGGIGAIAQVPTGFAVLRVETETSLTDQGTGIVMPGQALSASGSVRYTTDLSGFGIASVSLAQHEKPDQWNMQQESICRLRQEAMDAAHRAVEADLSSAPTRPASEALQIHALMGQFQSYAGSLASTIEAYRQAQRVARAGVPDAVPYTDEVLGIAHLHKAHLENGVFSAPGERCLLSTRPSSLADTSDLDAAVRHFTSYLSARPEELEAQWLLNLAHMGRGTYPGGVPAGHLIPPAAFESGENVGRFADVAREAGLVSRATAGGVIVDDFDNDGRFEVVTSSIDSCDALHYFSRDARGRFTEQAARAGLAGQFGGLNLMQTDYDNDGAADILVLRGGWETAQRKSLLRNNGNGTFSDVTAASGLASPPTATQAGVWTDVNQDGFLDLFVGNEDGPAQLFLNRRNGTFEDVGKQAGVARNAFTKGVAAGDYDNDGWPDLYVSNMGRRNYLYRNNRDGTFTERADEAGVTGPGQGFATWFFDYDNDGWQDIFVTSYFTSVDETVRTYLKRGNNAGTLKLYRNLQNGRFADVTVQAGLDKVFMPMGANYGDIDNDGFLDIYLGTGNPSYASLVPNVLLRNRAGKSFVDVTMSSGTGELHKGHGVAFADLDQDGDDEIVHEVGGATPNDAHALRLFDNPGNGNRWINVKLVGVKSNRAAVGARITVTPSAPGARAVHRVVGTGGSFGASPLQQHVGIGGGSATVDIEIWWPTGGSRQRFTGVESNQTIEIREFATIYTRLQRPALPFGARTNATATR